MISPYTVLIVDAAEDWELYRRYLRQDADSSCSTIEATSGQQGLALWQQQQPDVVLLDYCLPDMDGLEFLAQLQSSLQPPCLPVIVVTAQANATIAVQVMKAGAQDYLIKEQLNAETLQVAIQSTLRNVSLRQQLQRSEAALRESEERLRSALEASRMGTWDWNIQTGQIRWSPNLESMFGLEPGTFDGSFAMFADRLHPGDRDRVIAAIDHAVATGEDYDIEFRIVYPDGRLRWALSQGRVFYDNTGQPIRMAGNDIDITERKQAEAALRESEQRYAALAKISPVGIFRTNLQGDCVYVNDRWCELAGLSPSEAKGKGWLTALHPDDSDRVFAEWYHAAESNLPFQSEYRFQTPDGRVSWLIGQATAERDSEGNLVGYVGTITDITARKQVEKALQDSETQFRQLAENIDAVFWIKDIGEQRVRYVSPAYKQLWGLDPEELYENPQAWANYIHPENRKLTDQDFWEAAAGQFDQEYRIVLPNGQVRWVHDRCFPLRNEAGAIYRVIGIAEDITDRKQTEAILHKNKERLEMALNATQMGVWEWNLKTNEVVWSPYHEILLGYEPGNPHRTYAEWAQRVHPEDLHRVEETIQAAMLQQQSYQCQYRVIWTDGSIHWLEAMGKYVYDTNGQPTQMHGILLEITDRKQAEQRLQESEERLQMGMQVTGFALARFDYASDTVELSPEAADLYGLPTEPLVVPRTHIHATFHPDERDELVELIHQVLDPAGVGWFVRDHRIVCNNGKVKWLTVRKQVFFDRSSQPPRPTHAILVALDITHRKDAEQEREYLLLKEQTARAEAERANRIKDDFLAILSHELRSPLTPILGWAKMMQTPKFDLSKTAQALATIERNARLQCQLIDDLLDVSKILRGKLSIETAAVDLAFVIEAAIDTARTAAVAKSILLHSVIPEIGHVSGDAGRLQQVVWNLLSNAIKFTPINGRVDVCLERVGDQAQITVRDTGKGINPDFLPHIFESFRQEDASTTRKYGGLGLGLAIARSLVEAHGGTIWADSPGEGQGATFTIQLPLLNSKLEQTESSSAATDNLLDLRGVRVLTVDDESDARDFLTVSLTQFGAEVLTAASGAEVLATLESFQPDVLISDIAMPGIDGYTLIQQIRSLPPEKGGQVPAIALTAYARETDYRKAIASGYQRHITKPLDPLQLVRAVMALYPTAVANRLTEGRS